MTNDAFGLLRVARGDWLRVKCEVAYVRMLLAGQTFLRDDRREERFNPYHDDLGRFTNADGAVLPGGGRLRDGANGDNNQAARIERVAQAQGDNSRIRIGGNGGPALESGTLLGRASAAAGRYFFGPLGVLFSMTEPMGNGELIGPYLGGKSEGVLETSEGVTCSRVFGPRIT